MAVDHELAPILGLDPEAVRCPHQHFDRIRDEGPIVWSDAEQMFVVTGHEAVLEILHDPERFSSRSSGASGKANVAMARLSASVPDTAEMKVLRERNTRPLLPVLVTTDPPVHTRHRTAVGRAFTPRQVARVEARITGLADELVDGFIADGRVELVRRFTVALPSLVMAEALGLQYEALPMLRDCLQDLTRPQGNPALTIDQFVDLVRAKVTMEDHIEALIDERHRRPCDDMISELVSDEVGSVTLDRDEQLGVVMQLLSAGVMTTSNLLASLVLRLVSDGRLMALLLDDPSRIVPFVDEVLRLEAPVQGQYRMAIEDTTVAGVDVPAGSSLWLVFAAANRDPAVFPEPHALVLDRIAGPHLSFGHGIHHCLGANLARTQGRIAVDCLLRRLTDIELDGEPAYEPSFVFHGPKTLPLRFAARDEPSGSRSGRAPTKLESR